MSMAEKVVNFGIGEVYAQIEQFIKNRSNRSKATAEKYKRGIELFFRIVKRKQIRHLTLNDVQLTFGDFEIFINEIKETKEFSNSTINGHITAVSELLKYFKVKELVNDIDFIQYLKEIRLPVEENWYDPLTVEEIKEFADWTLNNEKRMGDIKYHFIRFSLETCLRLDEVMSLKWDDFNVEGEYVSFIVKTKNNNYRKLKIKRGHYNDLLQLKEKYKSDKVFKIGSTTMHDVLNRWKDYRGDFGNRYIVIHSIRKGGALHHYNKTKDILHVQKILGHSDVSTTRIYLRVDDYGAIGAISDEYENNYDLFEDDSISKEDLLNTLREMDSGFKVAFNEKLKNIIKNKD